MFLGVVITLVIFDGLVVSSMFSFLCPNKINYNLPVKCSMFLIREILLK